MCTVLLLLGLPELILQLFQLPWPNSKNDPFFIPLFPNDDTLLFNDTLLYVSDSIRTAVKHQNLHDINQDLPDLQISLFFIIMPNGIIHFSLSEINQSCVTRDKLCIGAHKQFLPTTKLYICDIFLSEHVCYEYVLYVSGVRLREPMHDWRW